MNALLSKLEVPVIQGGMGIGISMGSLAGAVASRGGMGVISTANIGFREPDFRENPDEANRRALKAEIRKARELSGGKGLIGINAMSVTSNYEDMVRTACEEGVDAVISGAGLPLSLPETVKDFDVMIAPVVSGGRAAKTILHMGEKRHRRSADFMVCEGVSAGGHLGFSREEAEQGAKSLAELTEDVVREAGTIPVFAAGGVFTAEDMKSVKEAGAYGMQIATRFIATEECDATESFKKIIIDAASEDVCVFTSPVGMPGRGLRTPLTEEVSLGARKPPKGCIGCIRTCRPSETPYCITDALISAYYGNYEEGLFFCDSRVGEIKEMTTVAALMKEIASEWSAI